MGCFGRLHSLTICLLGTQEESLTLHTLNQLVWEADLSGDKSVCLNAPACIQRCGHSLAFQKSGHLNCMRLTWELTLRHYM